MWSWGRAVLVVSILAAVGGECAAQGQEALGVRAQGMGGAFVAVADDATATYWNPAGLARGAIVSAVVEQSWSANGEPDAPAFRSSQQGTASFVGLSLPPIGVSYYRLRSSRVLPPGATPGSGRIATILPGDRGTAASLVTQNLGLTLVQSIGEFVDVAGTIRYVHGSAALGNRDATFEGSGAFDRVSDLPSLGSNTIDFDLGAMVHAGQLSVGLVASNLREPAFDAPGHPDALQLDRHVRAGLAWQFSQSPTVLAVDVDLTRTYNTGLDAQQHVAVGAEHQLHPRLTVRGGFRVNTVDNAFPAGSAGVSVAVRSSIWLDAQITHGTRLADRSWGLSARFGF
jgi:hypothetical protein